MWLRGLLVVTCLAVLAAIGYYFWGEYERSAAEARRAEVVNARENCLFSLQRYADRNVGDPNADVMLRAVERCVDQGLISADDINSAADRRFN